MKAPLVKGRTQAVPEETDRTAFAFSDQWEKQCWRQTLTRSRVDWWKRWADDRPESSDQLTSNSLTTTQTRLEENSEITDFVRDFMNENREQCRQTERRTERETSSNGETVIEVVDKVGQQIQESFALRWMRIESKWKSVPPMPYSMCSSMFVVVDHRIRKELLDQEEKHKADDRHRALFDWPFLRQSTWSRKQIQEDVGQLTTHRNAQKQFQVEEFLWKDILIASGSRSIESILLSLRL